MSYVATAQLTETSRFWPEGASLLAQADSSGTAEVARACFMRALSLFYTPTATKELVSSWQHVGSATTLLTQRDIGSLDGLYGYRGRREVVQFLSDHPFLMPLLLEAHAEIELWFPTHRQPALEVLNDAEEADDPHLVLFIRGDLPPAEAVDALHRLDKHWWLEASRESRGKLCIHVE